MDNLWITRRRPVQKSVDNSMGLTRLLPSSSASEPLKRCSSLRSLAVVGVLCYFIASLTLQMQPAQAHSNSDANHYKLYAHSRIIQWNEYVCFVKLINKENRTWNPAARNGSHFGIGQMRSQHYRTLDGYAQIDATLKYIEHRYGSVCKAWEHHKHGWY